MTSNNSLLQQQLAIASEIHDQISEYRALRDLGIIYWSLGDLHTAVDFHGKHLALACEIGDRRGEADAYWNLGLVLEQQGDLIQAAKLMQLCIDYDQETNHPELAKRADILRRTRHQLVKQFSLLRNRINSKVHITVVLSDAVRRMKVNQERADL